MSKSLKRVTRALLDLGIDTEIKELGLARTAQQAADVAGCALDQIAKSMIFRGEHSGEAILFLTAGGNQVDTDKASTVAGEPLGRADAALIRNQTGFAIGGVAPIGHLTPIRSFLDPRLLEFPSIWAAAGTPHHVFELNSDLLQKITDAQLAEFTS